MRTRSHEGHIALQDVEKLWQLVKAEATQNLPNWSDALISRAGLCHSGPVAFVAVHRPKFVNFEHSIVQAVAPLAKENGASRGDLDRSRNCEETRQQHEESKCRYNDVKAAFGYRTRKN
jgi:hypothetical protein